MKVKGMKTIANDRGFTILEVILAMTLLSIAILGIAGLAGTAIKSSSYSQSITQGNNLSQKLIEELMVVDFDNLQITDTTISNTVLRRTCTQTGFDVDAPEYTCNAVNPVLVDTREFTWSYKVTYIDLDGDGVAAPSSDRLKKLDVTVSWTDQLWHTTKSLKVVTLRSKR